MLTFFFFALRPDCVLASPHGASRSHSDTPHLVGLLWTSDKPDAGTSDNTQHSQETNNHGPGGIRSHNPSKRTATLHRAATVIGTTVTYLELFTDEAYPSPTVHSITLGSWRFYMLGLILTENSQH